MPNGSKRAIPRRDVWPFGSSAAAKAELERVQDEIAVLTRRAEELQAEEVREVVARMKVAIGVHGITEEQLFDHGSFESQRSKPVMATSGRSRGAAGDAVPSDAKHVVQRAKASVKYRDGLGNTWTGRGSLPRWLFAAIAEGRSREDFLVK